MEESSVDIGAVSIGNLHHIFGLLEPRDLCYVSATSKHWRLLSQDQASSRLWRGFYKQRWVPTAIQETGTTCWQTEYGSKMKRVNSWQHKHYQQDSLYGHSSAVQCLGIVPGRQLLATGSTDRTVKIWDMQAGMPLSSSRLHGGPVRCLAADQDMIVSGSSDHRLRIWLASPSCKAGFDLTDPIKIGKNGHKGPIAAVALDNECIYSGSWDYSMRVWQRDGLQLAGVVPFNDWVFSLASRGNHVLVGLSSSFHVLDRSTLQPVRHLWHQAGGVLSLEGSQDGRMAFSGGLDGRVLAHDLRLPDASSVIATLWSTSSSVRSLKLEDPWLATATADGNVALLHTEAASRPSRAGHSGAGPAASRRLFQVPQGAACCVDLLDQLLVAGSDNGVTSSWDCSKAEEKEGEVRAAKAARGRARQQKAEKHSSRLAQQREKAAQALAAVQTLHRDPASQEPATAHKAPAPAHMGTTTTDTVMTGTATGNSVVSAPDPSDADVRPHDYELRGNDGQQQQLADGQQSTATQTSARPLPSAQSMPIASAQSVPFVSAQSMPVQIQGTGLRSLSQNHGASPNECSDVVTERGSNSLTRGAGAVNSLRSRMVPLPMSPSHSLGSQCYSPNSMQSWQIVRPRPVQDRRSSLKGPSHVHVQA